jgi:2-amino-4-hydroxy-6-hydroxymethyldihydropteridine diphosphokinase
VRVAFSLGGNLDQPATAVRAAVLLLSQLLDDPRAASYYRSPALSRAPQPEFVNTALVGSTRLSPEWLLAIGKRLEWRAGRRRGPRHGPRRLDIDLLLYGDTVRAAAELTLPHPALAIRRFALTPLAEIAPNLAVPPLGTTVAELLARVPDSSRVERIV